MSAKSHIWPAYVDMMTVLLLVYILLNAMFSGIIATTKTGVADSTKQSSYQEAKDGKSQELTMDRENLKVEMNESDDLYIEKEGDLSIFLDDMETNTFPDKYIDKIKEWANKVSNKEGAYQVGIFLKKKDGETTGLELQTQVSLYYQVLSELKKSGVNIMMVQNKNTPPRYQYNSQIKIRFIPFTDK